jgi:imidazolonepropionase-like amidohydrolase
VWPQLAPIAQRVYERKTPCLRHAIEEGVRIAVGTDCGRHFPHADFASELRVLAEAGMTPEAVLLAATRTNAELLGVAHAFGSVEPGKLADLILLGGDPLEDLATTADVRLIVLDGHAIDPMTLRGSVPQSLGSPR